MGYQHKIPQDLRLAAINISAAFIRNLRQRSDISKRQLRDRMLNLESISATSEQVPNDLRLKQTELLWDLHAFEAKRLCPSDYHLQLIAAACGKEPELEVFFNILANWLDSNNSFKSASFLNNEALVLKDSKIPYWAFRSLDWFLEKGESSKCNPNSILRSLFTNEKFNSKSSKSKCIWIIS